MDKRTMANQLVADFGGTLSLENLELNEETNSCVLAFDDSLLLNIEYDEAVDSLVFSIYLDELPKEGAEPLLRELMGANLYWHRTRGATLCLEEGTNGIILLYSQSVITLDNQSFETIVENLLNLAEKWRNRIVSFRSGISALPQQQAADSTFAPIYG